MELTAFTLILVAAISHAVWNAVAKSAVGNPLTFVWAYLCLGALVLLPVTTIFLWEQGWPSDPHLIYTPLVSGVLHLIYLLTLQTAYRKGDLGVVYPTARGVGPLLTMIVAIGVIGERPRPSALMGALIIFAGILLVATASQGHGQGRGQGHTHWLSEGVLWGGATGVAISTYTLWDNRAMTVWDLDPLPFFTLALTTQALLLTPFALRQPNKHLRENWWRIILVAGLWPLAYILVLIAQKTTPISIVAPVREISIVFGAFIGCLVFKEQRPLRRVIAAAIVLGGIILLTR